MATVTRTSLWAIGGAALGGLILGARYHASIEKGLDDLKAHVKTALGAVKEKVEKDKKEKKADSKPAKTEKAEEPAAKATPPTKGKK